MGWVPFSPLPRQLSHHCRSLYSLHELVKHEENGLVFEDSEELAVQLQVALSAPLGGSQAFGDLLFLQLGGWAWAGSAAGVAGWGWAPASEGIRARPACRLGLRSSYHTGDARAGWTVCHSRGTGLEEGEGGVRGASWTSLARGVGVFKGTYFLLQITKSSTSFLTMEPKGKKPWKGLERKYFRLCHSLLSKHLNFVVKASSL